MGKFLLIIFILVAVNLHNVELSLKDYMLLRNTHLEAFSACHTPFRLHYFWLCCDKMFFIESKVPMLQPKLYRLHVEFVVFAWTDGSVSLHLKWKRKIDCVLVLIYYIIYTLDLLKPSVQLHSHNRIHFASVLTTEYGNMKSILQSKLGIHIFFYFAG